MKIYYKGSPTTAMDIMDADLSYWQGQGWTTSATPPAPAPPAPAPPATPPAPTPPASDPAGTAKATLYGPNGTSKVVTVGSTEASDLQSQGWGLTAGSYKAPNAPAGTSTAKWVNDLYQKYFDRDASSAEAANWSSLQPIQLEQYLAAEQKRYGYTSKAQLAAMAQGKKDAYAMIDADSNLTPEMKQLAKTVVDNYKGGVEADATSIMKTFNQLRTTLIDPHYQDLVNSATKQLEQGIAYQKKMQASEEEQMALDYSKTLDSKKKSLEETGMTFTGEAVKQLGGQSAVVPFGGMPEGYVPQQQRLTLTSSRDRYLEGLRQTALGAETQLGSAGVSGLVPEYSPIGGIAGTIQTQKAQEYGQTLQEVASNQQEKTLLNTNVKV